MASTERALGTPTTAAGPPGPTLPPVGGGHATTPPMVRRLVTYATAAAMLALILEITLGVPAAVTGLTGAAVASVWILEAVIHRAAVRPEGLSERR